MKYLFIIFAMFSLLGCAMTPENVVSSGNQIVVEFKVAGKININNRDDRGLLRNYIIAINCDNSNGSYGPIPVVYKAPNEYGWGNGWGTSDKASESLGITSFMKYDLDNSSGNFYKIIQNTQLRQYSSPITPISCEVTDDGKGIRAIIDYSQIATSSILAADITKLQINVINTNLIISNTNESTPGRRYDALSSFVDINTKKSYTYSGTDDNGDIADPDMDITSWKIEVKYSENN